MLAYLGTVVKITANHILEINVGDLCVPMLVKIYKPKEISPEAQSTLSALCLYADVRFYLIDDTTIVGQVYRLTDDLNLGEEMVRLGF